MLKDLLSNTTVVDLTQIIEPDMPVYPGTEQPEISDPCTIEKNGFAEKKLAFYSHTGTHMDAPAHIVAGAPTLDQLDAAQFIGTAAALDLSRLKKPVIDLEDLRPFEPRVKDKDFVILYTGWSHLWGEDAYFEGYPVLSIEAAQWLVSFTHKGIGVDMISIDGAESTDFLIHKTFLGSNKVIVENLTNLEGLLNSTFILCCTPLKIAQADGSPVRAIALAQR